MNRLWLKIPLKLVIFPNCEFFLAVRIKHHASLYRLLRLGTVTYLDNLVWSYYTMLTISSLRHISTSLKCLYNELVASNHGKM